MISPLPVPLLSPNTNEVPLRSRRRSGLFLSLVALVVLVGTAEAIKIATVAALAKSTEISQVRKGLAWDPNNPELHYRLSLLYGYSFGQLSLAEWVREARRATDLSPYKFAYWLNLASACESIGDSACAEQALQRALALSPMKPLVWWTAGNYFLRTDRPEAALQYFKHLLELSPDYAGPTFRLGLRAWADPKVIFENVLAGGKDPRLALAFADFMSANNDFETAHQAWTQVASRGSPFPFVSIQPYLERLLSRGRYQEAWGVWQDLERMQIIKTPSGAEEGNLVFNGGFEQPPLQAGFDWRSPPAPYVSVDFADPSAYQGAHCLRVDFTVGQNAEFEPVYQVLPVAPNRAYMLMAYVRTKDITSDSGPRLRVLDPACPSCLNASTETMVGTTPWHLVTLKFSAGIQTQALRLSVWRPRSRTFPMEITGSFWLDGVSIRALGLVGKESGFMKTH